MPSNAQSGLGTTLSFNSNTVSNITKIGGVEFACDPQEVTNLASTFKEYINGIPDGGEVEVEGQFYPGDTNGQVAIKNAVGGAVANIGINFPFGAAWAFTALVTKFSTGDIEPEGAVPFAATFKITGQPIMSITNSAGLTTPFFVISNSAVISPAASGSLYDYVATVLTGVSSVTVTPTATAGTITVNGTTVATGVASGAIALGAAGSITTVTIVVTETGKVPKTYVVRVVRP